MLRFSTWLMVLGLALAGCGSTAQRCTTLTCTGCCDTSGMCRTGSESSACGSGGNTCTACSAGGFCSFGTCSTGSSGAGSAGAGSAGGGTAGSGTGGGSTSNTVTDWASWCRLASAAVEGFYGRCGYYTTQGITESIAASQAACLTRPPPGLADGRASLNSTGASACIALFNGRSCAEGLPSGCEALVTGLVARGGNCYQSIECDSTSWCDLTTSCPGRCVARIALGQPVSGDARCVDGAYAYNSVCTALVAMGQSCAPTGGSSITRGCVNGGSCINNVCAPRQLDLTENQTCTPNTTPECARGLQCVANRCIPLVDLNGACDSARTCKWDLYCSPANVCVRPGAAGAVCGPDQRCATNLYCNRPTGSTTGTCAALKQVDQACTASFECNTDTMYCTATTAMPNGVCRLKGAVAATCTYQNRFAACAEGLYCTATTTSPNGVCANQKGANATCVDSAECQSRTCTTGRCTTPTCVDPTP